MYLCNICNCLIANKSDQIYKAPLVDGQQLNFKTFNKINNYKEDEFKKYEFYSAIYCKICYQEIGMRIKKDYSLYKTQLYEKIGQINIEVFSLKNELLKKFQEKVNKNQFCITYTQLLKKELTECNYHKKINNNVIQKINGAVIFHQIESRLLLIGKNGLYNDLLPILWKYTCGNVILLLYTNDNIQEKQLIQQVSFQGEQPIIADLYNSGHLIFYEEGLNLNQILLKFNAKSYNQCFPINQIYGTKDILEQKFQLLSYYYQRQKLIELPNEADKQLLKLLKKSRKLCESNCLIQ